MEYFKRTIYFLCLFSFLLEVNGDTDTNLIANITVNKYIKQDQIDTYHIIIDEPGDKVNKYLIDLMIFSGDVILLYDAKNNFHKYETANKIFLSITNDQKVSQYDINVSALKSSFYSIRYVALFGSENELGKINEIPINTNFLVTLYPSSNDGSNQPRKIKFTKTDYNPFLVNFYSLNCVHKIYKKVSEDRILLKSTDDYFVQDYIQETDINEFLYEVEISSIEHGKYNNKMCMIYANSYEVDNNFDKSILVGENVPQKARFNTNELKRIKYLYEIPHISNDIAIKFFLTERAKYDVNFYIGNNLKKLNENSISISAEHQEIIYSDSYKKECQVDQECKLIVEISLSSSSPSTTDLNLETTIKSISSTNKYPSYLIKNKINSEYLNFKSPNYYYTDIGQGISGEIIINYHRGNGMIFGKIVKKNEPNGKNHEWKGLYEFPKEVEGTMKYNSFLKKLEFTEKDTSECNNECYLLLNVVNVKFNNSDSMIGDDPRYFGFNILIITSLPSIASSSTVPLINLNLEKYVIGSISNEMTSPDYHRYYIMNIPSNTQKVILDLQSEDAAIYVNLYKRDEYYFNDYKYPIRGNSFWNFSCQGKPRLFQITKEDILGTGLIESLEGLSLTILIQTSNSNNELSSIYALKPHIELGNSEQDININEVYSDQQTLCRPEKIVDSIWYRCLYIVKYDKNDVNNHLLLHPVLEDETKDFIMYAKFISREDYDLYKSDKLKEYITKQDSDYNTEINKEDFLYIDLNNKQDKYLFVSIETVRSIIVKLLTTFSTFAYSISPNPSTLQLYIIKPDNEIKFTFINNNDFMINIVSVLGGAKVFWQSDEKKVHQIGGRDDRLSLTSPSVKKEYEDSKYLSLIIKNRNIISHSDSQIPGAFIFYLTFYFRSSKNNLDKFNLGKSFNLNYKNTYFPLLFYFSLDNSTKDTNAFITIYNLESNMRYTVKKQEFDIHATILSDSAVYRLKSNSNLDLKKNTMIQGVYDSSKRVGLLSLKSQDFKNVSIQDSESPNSKNLVIQISKHNHDYINELFSHISIEGTVIQDNSIIPVTEKVYQHGKLKNGSDSIMYRLNVNKAQKTMYLIFSANSDLLDFNISSENNVDNDEIQNEFNENKIISNGRIITHFNSKPDNNYYLILTIFKKDPNQDNENLTNYVFKYINVEDLSKVKFYSIEDPSIICTSENNTNHLINIEPISCDTCTITYYVNLILRQSLIPNESFNNIAVIQSMAITAEFKGNNLQSENNKVNLKVEGINLDFAYVQVIAHINEDSINEYIAYNNITHQAQNNTGPVNAKTTSNKTGLIVAISVVGGVFLAVLIILIVVIVRFNKKNKDLLNQVNSISFVDERNTINDDETTNNLIIN